MPSKPSWTTRLWRIEGNSILRTREIFTHISLTVAWIALYQGHSSQTTVLYIRCCIYAIVDLDTEWMKLCRRSCTHTIRYSVDIFHRRRLSPKVQHFQSPRFISKIDANNQLWLKHIFSMFFRQNIWFFSKKKILVKICFLAEKKIPPQNVFRGEQIFGLNIEFCCGKRFNNKYNRLERSYITGDVMYFIRMHNAFQPQAHRATDNIRAYRAHGWNYK